MNSEPSVSVVIPTFNRAALIGAAIQSVLDQTFKDVEIIVVDDGSTDETQQALEVYAGRIVSLVTENRGPAHARNVGMKAASGKYIAFLDSDDLYLPQKLELEVAFLEQHPEIGMVSTNMSAMRGTEIVDERHLDTYHGAFFREYGWTLDDAYPVRATFRFDEADIPCYSGNVFKYMLHWPVLISNTVLFRRSVLDSVGHQNEDYRVAEDYDHMVRICKHFSVAFLDVPTYVYRYNEDQISMVGSNWSPSRHSTWSRILETMIRVAEEHAVGDKDFHSNNKSWLDPLLSKKLLELGRKLIERGDLQRGIDCFARAHTQAPSQETFFSRMLGDVSEPTVPLELTEAQGRSNQSAGSSVTVDSRIVQRLRDLARAHGISIASLCHLAWAMVLARVSDREDVVFGTTLPRFGRDGTDNDPWTEIPGSTLPIRIRLNGVTVQEAIRQTHETLAGLLWHRDVALSVAQRCSAVPTPAPMFSALLSYARKGASSSVRTDRDIRKASPLALAVEDSSDAVLLTATAQSPMDPQRICAYMLTALEQLSFALVATPSAQLSSLEALPEAERNRLLVELNNTSREYPRDFLMHGLFEAQAKRTPERAAVAHGPTALSYSDLAARSAQIAHALRSRKIGRGQLVGLCLERGTDLLAAVLGILKSGAAYVPLDPIFPQERLRFMTEDAQLALLVSTSNLADLIGLPRERQLLLDHDLASIAAPTNSVPSADAELDARPDDPAYVIYTSGSTGKPKGVVVTHRSVVNFITSMAREPGLTADDVLVAVTTLSFDIAVLELHLPLAVGAKVLIANREEAVDGHALGKLLEQSKATIMQATPVTWRLLLESGWSGKNGFKALIGGEPLPQDLAEQLIAKGIELWNMYGPTETTVWSTCGRIFETSNGISIGKPIGNTTIYILDTRGRLSPLGVPGELCIGGDGVAQGYWNRPELTADRFVPNPFSKQPGTRIYRTGDRARWRMDGTLEHLGRLDFQVKIRGYRIELGEIEAGIAKHPAVRDVVVMAREDTPRDPRLVAYLVTADPPADLVEQLRALIRTTMPDYMVPAHFVTLEALPRTLNGKIDRKALPAPNVLQGSRRAALTPPSTTTEKLLANIWAEVLGLDEIGIDENFFDLGGHSLLLLRVHNRLCKSIRPDLSFVALMQYPTVKSLSRYLSGDAAQAVVPTVMADRAKRQREAMRRQRTIKEQT